MRLHDHLDWPFLGPEHRIVAKAASTFAASIANDPHPERRDEVDERCRKLVRAMGETGLTRYCVRAADGGALPEFDARSICLVRETLAHTDGLADFAFAMQGLGSGAITLAGSETLRARYLPEVAAGRMLAAFALSEPEAGSDVAAMTASARRDGDHYVLDGTKTWISNGGIADFYCVFARTSAGERRADRIAREEIERVRDAERNFYTTASTTIPNDQAAFAQASYGRPFAPQCRDTPGACDPEGNPNARFPERVQMRGGNGAR